MPFRLVTKSLLRAISCGLIVFQPSGLADAQDSVQDGDQWYVSASVGAAFPLDVTAEGGAQVDVNTDLFYTISLGGRIPAKLFKRFEPRFELEVSYLETEASSITIQGVSQELEDAPVEAVFIQLNLLQDVVWKEDQRIVPYFGGGIGVSILGSLLDDGDRQRKFTSSILTGASYNISKKWEIFAQGRYFRTFGVDDGDFSTDIDGFALSAGFRYDLRKLTR